MQVKNTTIQNRSKQSRLNNEHKIPMQNIRDLGVIDFLQSLLSYDISKEELIFSIGCNLISSNENPNVKKFLGEYDYQRYEIVDIPTKEFDLLGSIYQFLNSKKENLEKGSFYTGHEIALDMVKDLEFSNGEVIFDPACGSGSFLFHSSAPANQIFGIDIDPVAIMIAKFNYFIKFPNAKSPQLYCTNFFDWFRDGPEIKFEYIISNPPYGANLDISKISTQYIVSGESFSYFIETGFKILKSGGIFRYLLPEAILNVKRHTDIRNFILENTGLKKIKGYHQKFAGVMSDVYQIELSHSKSESMIFQNGSKTTIPLTIFHELKNHIFAHLTELDIDIIGRVNSLKCFDLTDSIFGLGVVTGDNKSKLFSTKIGGAEHIYTGKEVEKYRLLPPKNYLIFDRTNLQQVAPDEIYRAKVKLVYKTINKHLKIAIDRTGSLTINSANIFIPKIPGYSSETVAAFLNSDLYSYLNLKMFGGVNKVAKENLMAMPFPRISTNLNAQITELVKEAESSQDDYKIQRLICEEIYGLSKDQIRYIQESLI